MRLLLALALLGCNERPAPPRPPRPPDPPPVIDTARPPIDTTPPVTGCVLNDWYVLDSTFGGPLHGADSVLCATPCRCLVPR